MTREEFVDSVIAYADSIARMHGVRRLSPDEVEELWQAHLQRCIDVEGEDDGTEDRHAVPEAEAEG